MGGAEIRALQALDTEVHLHRVHLLVNEPEYPHRAHLEADPVVAAELPVDVHLDRNRRGRRDLQVPSHLSICPAMPAGRAFA